MDEQSQQERHREVSQINRLKQKLKDQFYLMAIQVHKKLQQFDLMSQQEIQCFKKQPQKYEDQMDRFLIQRDIFYRDEQKEKERELEPKQKYLDRKLQNNQQLTEKEHFTNYLLQQQYIKIENLYPREFPQTIIDLVQIKFNVENITDENQRKNYSYLLQKICDEHQRQQDNAHCENESIYVQYLDNILDQQEKDRQILYQNNIFERVKGSPFTKLSIKIIFPFLFIALAYFNFNESNEQDQSSLPSLSSNLVPNQQKYYNGYSSFNDNQIKNFTDIQSSENYEQAQSIFSNYLLFIPVTALCCFLTTGVLYSQLVFGKIWCYVINLEEKELEIIVLKNEERFPRDIQLTFDLITRLLQISIVYLIFQELGSNGILTSLKQFTCLALIFEFAFSFSEFLQSSLQENRKPIYLIIQGTESLINTLLLTYLLNYFHFSKYFLQD